MKPGYSRLIIGLIIFGLSAASCGGGGGSISSSHAPSLSGLYLYPNSTDQYTGNGTIQVNYGFNFTDAGGDLFSMTVTVYDGDGTVLDSGTDQFQDASGITDGYISGDFSADTSVAGNYKIAFSVADSGGKVSNVVEATFTVFPVASLVSIEVTPANPTIDAGAQQQFTAIGTYDDTTTLDITDQVTWTSSDVNVATINYWGYQGLAMGKNRGSTTITAARGAISGFTVLNVLSDFGQGVKYPGAFQYQSLGNTAIGDLNGDGRNDVAVVDMFNNGSHLYVYYQKSDHTLDSVQVITSDLNLEGIAIADVNNDGLADLIVAGIFYDEVNGGGKIYVYKQDPVTHALGQPQKYPVSSFTGSGFAVADVNNDGLPDIIRSGVDLNSNGVVSILFQGQTGTLNSEATYTHAPVNNEGELHVADMNNDGLNDIVFQSGTKQLAVIKQLSPGTFSITPDYYTVQTGYWPYFNSFALGDLNNDGRADLAAVDIGNDSHLNLFTQDNMGLLTGPSLTQPFNATEIHIADMNGDGLNDIILLNDGYLVQILYQADDHSFPAVKTYRLPTGSFGGTSVHQAMSIGDVTGDGLPDIVASWSDDGIFVLPRLP